MFEPESRSDEGKGDPSEVGGGWLAASLSFEATAAEG